MDNPIIKQHNKFYNNRIFTKSVGAENNFLMNVPNILKHGYPYKCNDQTFKGESDKKSTHIKMVLI